MIKQSYKPVTDFKHESIRKIWYLKCNYIYINYMDSNSNILYIS